MKYKNIACTDFANVNIYLNLHSYEENYTRVHKKMYLLLSKRAGVGVGAGVLNFQKLGLTQNGGRGLFLKWGCINSSMNYT